jgi:predicted glycosyltransferase
VKYLFDIGHPAHVHYFKNLIRILEKNGHRIAITTRDKEVSLCLLDSYKFQYTCTGKNLPSKIGKLYSILRNDLAIFRVAKIFKPDLFISFFSPFAAHVGKLIGKPVIGFNDTENANISIMFAKPFTDFVIVPNCYKGTIPLDKKIKFNGYFELSYLHPHRFSPDPSVLNLLGVGENRKYVILRFVSWSAGHDFGHLGMCLDMKRMAVKKFSKYAKVFISSEKKLPDDLMKYQITIPPEMMHSALFYAALLYGESATMASECAVLGTPAIYIDNKGRGYTDEEEKKYGLVFNFTESIEDQKLSIRKGVELLKTPDIKQIWQVKRKKMLSDMIDVTKYMVWLIENYPESARIMKEDPDYQYRFRSKDFFAI